MTLAGIRQVHETDRHGQWSQNHYQRGSRDAGQYDRQEQVSLDWRDCWA